MIKFMLLAAPRSGTAWAANFLTTDATLCLHEPLARWNMEQLDGIESGRTLGVACTALALFPGFVNAHPAKKVILHRDAKEVRASAKALGLNPIYDFAALDRIDGLHCHWRTLFTDPARIFTYLLGKPFDAERHRELVSLNIQNLTLINQLREDQRVALAHG